MKLLMTLSLLLLVNRRSLAQNEKYELFIKEARSFIEKTGYEGKNSYGVYFARFFNANPDSSFCFAVSSFTSDYRKKHITAKYFTYVGTEIVLIESVTDDRPFNGFLYKVDTTVFEFVQNKRSSEHLIVTGEATGIMVCFRDGEIKRLDYTGDMPRQVSMKDFTDVFSPKSFDMNKFKY